MHDHANRLRTGPCLRDRHWYVPVGGDMRCERCDEEPPRFEKRWERCPLLAIDPATPDQPPIVATADGFVNLNDLAPRTGSGVRDWLRAFIPPVPQPPFTTEQLAQHRDTFKRYGLRILDDLEPMDLTAPAKRLIRVTSPTWIPIVPAVDIHPNGGIPG
jgi:hypothetical protein